MIPVALTVAGSDCTGGAGIQADLKTFAALGVYGESVITSVVAENTCRVFSRQDISPEMVTAQLDAVYQDIPPHAVKLGMLPTIQVVEAVADWLAAHPKQPVVTDPVLVATSGDDLVDRKALETIQTKLLPLTTVLTPNLPEAEALTGIAVTDEVSMKAAAAMLCNMGAKAVLVKGGHLQGEALDILCDGKEHYRFSTPRIPTRCTHGTGCTLSSAIAAYLALGKPLVEAVQLAKEYLQEAIRQGTPLGQGHGPTHHMHPFYRWDAQ